MFECKDGLIHIQRKRHMRNHLAPTFSTKFPVSVLLHNARVIDGRRRVFERAIRRSGLVWFYGHCRVCREPFRITSVNLIRGHGCATCAGIKRHTISSVRAAFASRGYRLITKRYVNAHSKLRYECPNHGIRKIKWNSFQRGTGCRGCQYQMMTGNTSPSWKGGITPIQNKMRGTIREWVNESIRAYGGRCLVTGRGNVVVHHLVSFSTLLAQSMSELGILAEHSSDLSDADMKRLIDLLRIKHFALLGVPVNRWAHDRFHIIYGKGGNTPRQFIEFASKYRNADMRAIRRACCSRK